MTPIPAGISRWLPLALLFAAGLYLGRCSKRPEPPRTIRESVVDTVPAPELLERIAALEDQRTGLRAIIAGLERRGPATITRTDTLIAPPDTIVLPVFGVRGGMLSVPILVMDTSGLGRPELHGGLDTRGCDDGWGWSPAGLVCNRPRFGHLTLYGAGAALLPLTATASAGPRRLSSAGLAGEAGVSWQPRFRSTARVDAFVDTEPSVGLRLRFGWRVF